MAELRYTYLLDVKDRASRAVTTANERIARSAQQANRAMEKQGAVAQSASRQIQSAGARQAAEWKQVARAAQTAERSVAQSATQASTSVSKALERQVAAQRKAGASYAQIARAQKAAGASARETAAAIEQSALREQKAMTASSGAARKHSGVLGGLRSQLKGFGGMAAGLGATFAAFKGLDFLRESVNDVEDLAKATIKLQAITGQDAKTASSWLQVAKQRGISTRQLSMAFITLEKNQVKAAAGSKTQAGAFRALGISQEQLRRSNPQQLIERVADGMKRLGPGAQRAAAAQQLLGRGGQLLIATLSGGSQKLRDQLALVQKYGAALNEKGVRNAAKLVAEQRKLDLAMLGLKVTVGQAIIPYLTKGGQALSRFVAQMRSGTGTGGQVRKVLEQVGSAVGTLAKALGPVAKTLGQAFGPAAKVAATAIRGMSQTIRGIVGVVKGVVGVVTRLIHGDFAGAWRAVKGIVRSALSGLGGLVKTLMAPVYTFAASAVRSAVRAMGRLGGGIAGALKGAARGVAGAASSVAGGVLNVFRTLARLVAGVWDGIVRTIRGAFNKVKGAIDTITSLPAKGVNAIVGRSGGVAHPDGFRRYQAGGVVPAMVSPGEMIVHQGRAGMVPGHPVAADNVAMMLPVGAAVLTGDGQRMVSQGATIGQAIARQAPHYATGGWVRTGATVFNDPPPGAFGSLSGGYAELGTATRGGQGTGRGYIARALGLRGELPKDFPLDVKIHGRTKRLRKRDRGYGQGTPAYSIDIWRDSWPAFGINSSFKGPALIRPAAGPVPSARGGGSRQAVSYSPRGRLITSGRAMQLGFQAGLEGGSLYGVYSSVRDAVTYNRSVRTIPGSGGGGGPAPRRAGRGSLVNARRPIGDTWAWARAFASRFGLRISSNSRSPAHNRAVGGVPNSWHTRGSARRPEAFDFVPPSAAALRWVRGHTRPAEALIHNAGSGLHLHVGGLYRRGGIIGAQRFRGGGPVAIGRPVLQPTAGGVTGLSGAVMTAYQRTLNMIRQGQEQLLRAGAHSNEQIAAGLHLIDQAIQRVHQVSYGRLEKMAKQLKSAIATTKDPDVARRLKGELRLVFGEMGRRIGLLAKEAADMVDPATRAAVHVERILKASKGRIDMTTTAALGGLERATNVSEATLRAAIGKLQAAYQRAAKSGLKGAMHTLAGQIADLMTQLGQVMADAAQAAADAAAAVRDAARTRFDQQIRAIRAGLQLTGVDPGSPTGLGGEVKIQDATTRFLAGQKKDLQNQWFLAPATQRGDILAQIQELDVQIQESAAASADFARQQAAAVHQQAQDAADAAAQARQDAADRAAQAAQDAADRREAERQAAIDAATSRVSLAQGGLQTLELQQRLANTYDTGGQARADYITSTIIPAIQAEIKTLQARGASAEDIQRAQNDLLQEQLDAQDAIKQNTADAAESLAKLGGTLGFEFQGSRLTDDLLASGVGA